MAKNTLIFSTTYMHIAIALLTLLPCIGSKAHAQDKRVGVIIGLTGPVAEVGESIKNGILLAKSTFDKNNKMEFIFEDDQFQSKNSVSAAEKLISVDKIDCLITFGGSTSTAVAQIAEQKKIPMIAITSLSSIGKNKSYVYSLFLSMTKQVELTSNYIESKNLKNIGIITTTQEALIQLKNEFINSNKNKVVINEEVVPGEVNLSSLATKYKQSKADGILLYLLPPQLSIFSRQLRSQGYRGQIFGGPPMYNPSEIKNAGGALTGAILPGPDTKNLAEINSQYQKTYNRLPISEGIYGYDAAHLLIEAANSEDINSYLKNSGEFQGSAGTYPKDQDNVFNVPSELREIKEDGSIVTKEF